VGEILEGNLRKRRVSKDHQRSLRSNHDPTPFSILPAIKASR
jgi:hypothetical protein